MIITNLSQLETRLCATLSIVSVMSYREGASGGELAGGVSNPVDVRKEVYKVYSEFVGSRQARAIEARCAVEVIDRRTEEEGVKLHPQSREPMNFEAVATIEQKFVSLSELGFEHNPPRYEGVAIETL